MIINKKIEKEIILNVFNKKKYYFEEIFTLANIAIGSFVLFILFLFFKKNNSVNYPYIENEYSNPKKFNDLQESTQNFEESIKKNNLISKEEKKEILEQINKIKNNDKKIYNFISEKNKIIKSLKKILQNRNKDILFYLDEISNGIFNDFKNRFKSLREYFKEQKTEIDNLENICINQQLLINDSKELFAKIAISLKDENKTFSEMYNQHFGPYSYDNIKKLYDYSIKENIFYFKILLSPTNEDKKFIINGIFPTTIYNHNLSFQKNEKEKYEISYQQEDISYSKTFNEYNDFLKIIDSGIVIFDNKKEPKIDESKPKEKTSTTYNKKSFFKGIEDLDDESNEIEDEPSEEESSFDNTQEINNYDSLKKQISDQLNEYKKNYDDFLSQSKEFIKLKNEIDITSLDEYEKNEIKNILKKIEEINEDKEFYNKKIQEINDIDLRSFQLDLSIKNNDLLINLRVINLFIDDIQKIFSKNEEIKEELKNKIKKQIKENYLYIKNKIDEDFEFDENKPLEEIIKEYLFTYDFFKKSVQVIEELNDVDEDYCSELKAIIEFQEELYDNIVSKKLIDYNQLLEHLKQDIKIILEDGEKNFLELKDLVQESNKQQQINKIKEIKNKIDEQIKNNVSIFEDDIEIKIYSIEEYYDFYKKILFFLKSKKADKLIYELEKTLYKKIDERSQAYFLYADDKNNDYDDYEKILKILKEDQPVFKKVLRLVKSEDYRIKTENKSQYQEKRTKIKKEIKNQIEKNVALFNDIKDIEIKNNYKLKDYLIFCNIITNFLVSKKLDKLIYEDEKTLIDKITEISNDYIKDYDSLFKARNYDDYEKILIKLKKHYKIFIKILEIIKQNEITSKSEQKFKVEKTKEQIQKELEIEKTEDQQEEPKKELEIQNQKNEEKIEPKKVIDDVIDSLNNNKEIKKYLKIDDNKYTLVDDKNSNYSIIFNPPVNNKGIFTIYSKNKNEDKNNIIDINKIFLENNSENEKYIYANGKYELKKDSIKIIEINFEINPIEEIKDKIMKFKINNNFISLIKNEINKYFNSNNKDKNIKLNPTDKILFVMKGKEFNLVFEKGSGLSKNYFYFSQGTQKQVIEFKILEFNDNYKFNLIDIYKFFKINNKEFDFLQFSDLSIDKMIEEQKKLEEPLSKEQSDNQNLSYDQDNVGFLKITNINPNHPEYLMIKNRNDFVSLRRNQNIEIYFYIKNINNDNQLLSIKIDDSFSNILQNIDNSNSKIIHDKKHYSLNDIQRKEIKKILKFFKHIIPIKNLKIEREINFNIVKITSNNSLIKDIEIDNNSLIYNKNHTFLETIEKNFIKKYFLKKIN